MTIFSDWEEHVYFQHPLIYACLQELTLQIASYDISENCKKKFQLVFYM